MSKKAKHIIRTCLLSFIFLSTFFGYQLTAHADNFHTVSGNFTDKFGNPIQATLCLTSNSGNSASVQSDTNGSYSVNVVPDTYNIGTCDDYAAVFGGATTFQSLKPSNTESSYVINATDNDATQNLRLDTTTTSFNVKQSDGSAAPNVTVAIHSQNSGSTTLLAGRTDVPYRAQVVTGDQTDFNGIVQAVLLKGLAYQACATDNSIMMTTCTVFTPSSDNVSININFPSHNTISGKFNSRLGDTGSVPNITLMGSNGEQPILRYSATDGISTTYSANVTPDTYSLKVSYQGNDGYNVDLNSNGYILDATSGNIDQDLQLDTTTLNVQLKDTNGKPVKSDGFIARATGSGSTSLLVSDSSKRFSSNFAYSESIIPTNSNGISPITLVSGLEYNICAIDPTTGVVSSSVCTTVTPLDNNSSNIVLTFPYAIADLADPVLSVQSIAGQSPYLTWNSVSGANFYSIYRDGTLIYQTRDTTYVDTQASLGSHTYYVEVSNGIGYTVNRSNSVTVVYRNIPLTITASVSKQPNNYGWYNSPVTIIYTCNDDLSAIPNCPLPKIVNTEGANQVIVGTATDNFGDMANVTNVVNIDKTPPMISGPTMSSTFILSSNNETLSATTNDTLSGVSSGEFYVDADPGLGHGATMSYSNGKLSATMTINGLKIGQHKLYMRSKDKAGNWSSAVSVTFTYV